MLFVSRSIAVIFSSSLEIEFNVCSMLSLGLLRWKLEMHMTSRNRPYILNIEYSKHLFDYLSSASGNLGHLTEIYARGQGFD